MKCVGVQKRLLRPQYDYDTLYCTSQCIQVRSCHRALWQVQNKFITPHFLSPQPFHPMVNLVCSPDLRMFLCALYAPVCTVYGQVSMPCRSLCQRAKDECHKIMEVFGVVWPDDMECSRCVCLYCILNQLNTWTYNWCHHKQGIEASNINNVGGNVLQSKALL